AFGGERGEQRGGLPVLAAHHEFVERPARDHAETIERVDALLQILGAAQAELADLLEAAAAEHRRPDREGERDEAVVRADVGGRALAADVLLPGAEREHEAAPPVLIHRLPAEPARHLADVVLLAREEPDAGTAQL